MPLRPRPRGCPFLGLLSFGQAKESNRRPGMVDETHTDVSRISRQRAKIKMDSGFRRNDDTKGFRRNDGGGELDPGLRQHDKTQKKNGEIRVPILIIAEGFALRCCDTSARW